MSHGRFGRLTPVAVLDPVELGGVTVQSASLHNLEDIHRKDIRPGTRVVVERAGDVIPQVTGPEDPGENGKHPIFRMPAQCPACGTPVETREGEVGHWCPNLDCPALLPEQLKSFVGKRAMEIDGLGEHWCQELVERELVRNTGDIYFVTREEWLSLERMGDRLVERILHNIEASRQRPMERVLYSLGIFRLGRDVSEKLARRFGSVEEIGQLSREQLEEIPGIGPEIAGSVVRGFRSTRVQTTIERLKEAGVNMTAGDRREGENEKMATTEQGGKLEGMTVVVTGKLEGMTRGDAEGMIRQHGGKASSSVTKTTRLPGSGREARQQAQQGRPAGGEGADPAGIHRTAGGVGLMEEQELTRMGWKVVQNHGGGRITSLVTSIPNWKTMTWAQRVFHQAAHGFTQRGELFIPEHQLEHPETRRAVLAARCVGAGEEKFAQPRPLPGADERLRKLLRDHVDWDWLKCREDSVVWNGPDGSIVLTCPEGWGIPGRIEREPALYCEFGEKDGICPWQEPYGEQPVWSTDPPAKPRDGLRPLGNGWRQEFSSTEYGITHTRYRREELLGETVDETDDGHHLLRWSRKHSRKLLTETTHPMGQPGWTITLRNPGIGQGMVTAASRRRGKTERIGSALSQELVYPMVHDHVRRTAHRDD